MNIINQLDRLAESEVLCKVYADLPANMVVAKASAYIKELEEALASKAAETQRCANIARARITGQGEHHEEDCEAEAIATEIMKSMENE